MDLHSNMVRFIMDETAKEYNNRIIFTFQYGQIYYMEALNITIIYIKFTFQYGQIYYLIYTNIN